MRNIITVVFLLLALCGKSQNTWPKSYAQPLIDLYSVIEDNDHGFLATATYNNDGNTWLLKFDANANLLWKKCLHYDKWPELWSTHFVKDRYKNLYLIGSTWDTDPVSGDAFILKLDSCYHKVNSVVYTDTLDKEQQYIGWNYDLNDSLLLLSAWGFNAFSNHLIFANKADLLPKKTWNCDGNTWLNNLLKTDNNAYLPFGAGFYLKGTNDTDVVARRTVLLKLDTTNGNRIFYKFFGFDENLLSNGYEAFKNKAGNIFVFSIFIDKVNDKTHIQYSPMVFECDTNGTMLNYKVISDETVTQSYCNAIQWSDSLYFLAMMYHKPNASLNSYYNIKFYRLNAQANRIDSFYMNNFGRKYFVNDAINNVHLIKTFDNKLMCVFVERDSDLTHPRITFYKFDTNFKPDTTQYRNLIYDAGCGVMNDTITLAGSPVIELEADTTYPYLKLDRPLGIIQVPKTLKLSFYPNPVKEQATLSFDNALQLNVRIELYDAGGRLVEQLYEQPGNPAGSENIIIQLTNYPAGMYYFKIYEGTELVHTVRCIKSRE